MNLQTSKFIDKLYEAAYQAFYRDDKHQFAGRVVTHMSIHNQASDDSFLYVKFDDQSELKINFSFSEPKKR